MIIRSGSDGRKEFVSVGRSDFVKWVNLAAFAASAILAFAYFYEDKYLLGILWLITAIVDGVMFVARDNEIL